MSLKQLQAYTERLKIMGQIFRDGRGDFLAERETEYRMICAKLVVSVLSMLRPADREPDEWDRQLSIMAAMVSSQLFEPDQVGLLIWLENRQQGQFDSEVVGPEPGIFGKDTVREWVQAGIDGDPEGKQLDERDRGDSVETIANRVWWAMYGGKSGTSHDLIRKYLDEATFQGLAGDLPELLKAWFITIRAIVRIDWREWVGLGISGEPY